MSPLWLASEKSSLLGVFRKKPKSLTILSLLLMASSVLFSRPVVLAQTYQSEPAEVGFRDFSYTGGGVTSQPTMDRAESKLWYHNGYWSGVLWDPVRHAFRIHRFDANTQNWMNTGPDVDGRRRSSADALWDDSKLYIASRAKEAHKDIEGLTSLSLIAIATIQAQILSVWTWASRLTSMAPQKHQR